MADEEQEQEKTLDPTEKRKQEFRERGEVPRSKELTSAFSLAVAGTGFVVWAGLMGRGFTEVFTTCFEQIPNDEMTISMVLGLTQHIMITMLWMLGLPLGLAWLVVILVEVAQGRGAVNQKEPIKFDFKKLDPLQGTKQQFMSSRPLVELAKGLLKLLLIAWLIYSGMREHIGMLPKLVFESPSGILAAYKEIAFIVLSRSLPVAFIIAVFDYGYQYYQNWEKMKMTQQEVKDETKNSDGDPQLKGRRRQRAREIAMATTLRDVAKADLIITNPTHYAIAIRYNTDEAPAPVVVAKGVDHMALKIKAEAARRDIPRIENRPLARALYPKVTEGQMIPEEFYGPVARVLAVIVGRKNQRRVSRRLAR